MLEPAGAYVLSNEWRLGRNRKPHWVLLHATSSILHSLSRLKFLRPLYEQKVVHD